MGKVTTRRVFDIGLKREIVEQIDTGKLSVSEVSKLYKVSRSAVYKWLKRYSSLYKSQTRVIVEKKSLSEKNKELSARIKELEAALGRKQMRVEYLEKVIDVSSSRLGEDLEKKDN